MTGPDPNPNSIAAAIRVVRFASTMVLMAREYPASIAEIGVRPALTSSRMRSKTKTLRYVNASHNLTVKDIVT